MTTLRSSAIYFAKQAYKANLYNGIWHPDMRLLETMDDHGDFITRYKYTHRSCGRVYRVVLTDNGAVDASMTKLANSIA